MGLFDYLDDGTGPHIQVKCFNREMNTYAVGDMVPLAGNYSIALLEGGWANVSMGMLTSFTDQPVHDKQVDKWGNPFDLEGYPKHNPYRRMQEGNA